MDLNQIGFTIALASIVFLFYLVYYMFSSNTSNENKKKEEYVDLKANSMFKLAFIIQFLLLFNILQLKNKNNNSQLSNNQNQKY